MRENTERWKELRAEVAVELDPQRLFELTRQINEPYRWLACPRLSLVGTGVACCSPVDSGNRSRPRPTLWYSDSPEFHRWARMAGSHTKAPTPE